MGHWRMDYEGVAKPATPERTTESCKVSVLYNTGAGSVVDPSNVRCCLCNAEQGGKCRLSEDQYKYWIEFNKRFPPKRKALTQWDKLRWAGNAISFVLTAAFLYYLFHL